MNRRIERIENGFSNVIRTPYRHAWLDCEHAVRVDAEGDAPKPGSMIDCESCDRELAKIPEIRAAIEAKAFSHARAGVGCWRGQFLIYHRDPESPTGVRHILTAREKVVEPILRLLGRPGALSPVEPR